MRQPILRLIQQHEKGILNLEERWKMLRTKQTYVPLKGEVWQALITLAQRNQRHPKHEAARIIELYLRKRGLIEMQEAQHGRPSQAA